MSNINWNKQTAPSNEQKKSETRRGQEPSIKKPSATQVATTRPPQKSLGKEFKSKKEMIDPN